MNIMYRNLLKALVIINLSFMCNSTYAGLISYKGYTLNEEKNIVNGNSLEWLQWDVTVGMSISSALADIADGNINGINYGTGWGLASNINIAYLFNSFDIKENLIWNTNENIGQTTSTPIDAIENESTDPEKQLVRLFGNTWTQFFGNQGSLDPLEYTSAIFGYDLDNDNLYNQLEVTDDFTVGVNSSFEGYAKINADNYSQDYSRFNIGIALVRPISDKISKVPSPDSYLIMIASLFSLYLMRSRQFKENKSQNTTS